MVDGHATRVPVKDRLDGLESYEQVWGNSNPIQDPKHIIANQEPYRCCRFSGCAVPIICGRKFKLHLPASPTRRIRSKMWSLDLDDIQLDPEYCATDLSQDLLVLCGAKTATTWYVFVAYDSVASTLTVSQLQCIRVSHSLSLRHYHCPGNNRGYAYTHYHHLDPLANCARSTHEDRDLWRSSSVDLGRRHNTPVRI